MVNHSISGWHNISSNVPSIEVNKVTFEDIISIINSIKNKKIVKDLESLYDELYKHLVNLLNPHEVTVDQLPEQVIDIFYNKWLEEGYYGTKDEFIEMLFRYITISKWEDMLDGTDPEIVPTVKHFYDYLMKHNTDIVGVHENILDNIFIGNPLKNCATSIITYDQYVGIPYTVNKLLNEKTKQYENIPLAFLSFPDTATVFLHGKYVSGTWFTIKNDNTSTKFFSIKVDAVNHKVYFSTNGRGIRTVQMTIDTTPLLQDIKNNANKITIVMVLDGNKLFGYVQLLGNYLQIPIKSKLIEINGTIVRYTEEKRQTYNTYMTIPRMIPGDFLEILSIYPYALNKEELSFVFNIFD